MSGGVVRMGQGRCRGKEGMNEGMKEGRKEGRKERKSDESW